MKRVFKSKIFSDAIIYTLSTIISRGINFFLIPVLTYYLTKEDYGYLGLILSIVVILRVYIGLFPSNFLLVKYSACSKEEIGKYISNIFIILVATYFMVLGILFLTEGLIFDNIEDSKTLLFLISIYALLSVIFRMLSTIIQLEKNALKYALFQFLWVATSISIALVLIIEFDWGWRGKFYAELFILLCLAIYTVYYFIKNRYLIFDFSRDRLKELFFYLFPLTFAVVGSFLMGTIDKVILSKYMNLEAVGVYAIAMTMAVIINIVFDAAMKSWEPYFFEKLNRGSLADMKMVVKVIILYKLFVILFSLFYLFIIPYIFDFMVDDKFSEAMLYIPILVIAFAFEGLRKSLAGFLTQENRVKTLGGINFLAAILNIILNIILIPKLGIYGAAYATLISFATLYIVTFYLALSHSKLSWRVLKRGSNSV